MSDLDVIGRIKELCDMRGWSYYKLSKESEIPQSTINNMLTRTTTPTVPTLQKLCDGFGITMADFFSNPEAENLQLTEKQKQILTLWNDLSINDKKLVLAYIKGLTKK